MEKPVKPFVYIGRYKQHIHYEGENLLCTSCGNLGHNQSKCSIFLSLPNPSKQQGSPTDIPKQDTQSD